MEAATVEGLPPLGSTAGVVVEEEATGWCALGSGSSSGLMPALRLQSTSLAAAAGAAMGRVRVRVRVKVRVRVREVGQTCGRG
jgi:hypothetical protein